MSRRYFAATAFCFIALTYFKVEVSANNEKELCQHLFEGKGYDSLLRPVKDPQTAVQVTLGLAPISIKEAVIESWIVVKWKDEYLTWNPQDFGNIEQIYLPVSRVWSPSLFKYPGGSNYNPETYIVTNKKSNVAIRFDGELMWMSPYYVVLDYEIQDWYKVFKMSIISWNYDVSQLDIDINNEINETLTGVTLKTSKELKYFSWSAQPYALINFTFNQKA